MLSFISKKVNKAYTASKKVLVGQKQAYKQTQQYKLIRSLEKFDSEILPTTKLNQLASKSYDQQKFNLVYDIMIIRINLKNIQSGDSKKLKQFRNSLIICAYLIKHGASGFIDQFRQEITAFQDIFSYIQSNREQQIDKKCQVYLNQIIERARYIIQLLKDKNKLIKQKQISMLIKKKIIEAQKQKQTNFPALSIQENQNQKNQKVESFLQNYVWRYINIIDGKIDQVAELLVQKIEKYLLEQQPQSFSIEQLQIIQDKKPKTELDLVEKKLKQQEKFVQKRQNVYQEPRFQDLL